MMPQATEARIADYKRKGGIVVDASDIGELANRYTPDFATGEPAIGFIHRHLPDAEIYFVANTSNQPVHATARVRTKYAHAEWWDPCSGDISAAGARDVVLDLAPYESRILVFAAASTASPQRKSQPEKVPAKVEDISNDWTVSIGPLTDEHMPALRSWAEDARTRFFSGVARYEKTVRIEARGRETMLDFGQGTPVVSARLANGMRAWFESPVREAAVVYVNGRRAGSVWKPPYEIDVTKLIQPGTNTIRIEVGNLAINELAGQSLPTYHLLQLRYGDRFQPQDMRDLQPLPSGLLGPVRLIVR
jgi:hypothetical protein